MIDHITYLPCSFYNFSEQAISEWLRWRHWFHSFYFFYFFGVLDCSVGPRVTAVEKVEERYEDKLH